MARLGVAALTAVMAWVRGHGPLTAFGLGYYVVLLGLGALTGNGQTPVYAVFMAVLFALVILADRKVGFGDRVLWALAGWGLLHLCGGLVPAGDDRVLYEVWLLPVVRFDHMVHAFGFGAAGVACWVAARRAAPGAFTGWAGLWVVVLGGTGLGAMNELVEFLISRTVPDTKIGGYDNAGWDLVANLVGCVVAGVGVARSSRGDASGDPGPGDGPGDGPGLGPGDGGPGRGGVTSGGSGRDGTAGGTP